MARGFEEVFQAFPIGRAQGLLEGFSVCLESRQSAEEGFAVVGENRAPQGGVASCNARGVAQALPGEGKPEGGFFRKAMAEHRRKEVGEVADVRDEFIVGFGRHAVGVHTEGLPEMFEAAGSVSGCARQGR